jgi:hypothetical protein
MAVDASVSRLHRPQDIANKFVDGEDTYNNKRTRSPGHDCSSRRNNQKHVSLVAA